MQLYCFIYADKGENKKAYAKLKKAMSSPPLPQLDIVDYYREIKKHVRSVKLAVSDPNFTKENAEEFLATYSSYVSGIQERMDANDPNIGGSAIIISGIEFSRRGRTCIRFLKCAAVDVGSVILSKATSNISEDDAMYMVLAAAVAMLNVAGSY